MRRDVVGRAMRLIADGTVDRDGVTGLAARLGYSTRQLERHLLAEVGAGPLALARAQRAQTARVLIETTGLPFADVAFAAGLLQHPAVQRHRPRGLRRHPDRAAGPGPATGGRRRAPGVLTFRLPFRAPFAPDSLFGHLAATAVPGCEEVRDGAYRRTLRLPRGSGIVSLTPTPDHVLCRLSLDDLRDLSTAIARCRRLLDLDADPRPSSRCWPRTRAAPRGGEGAGPPHPRHGRRGELAVRIVLGQQVSTAAARTHAARLVARHGTPVTDPGGGLTHLFPSVEDLADLDPATLGLPRARRRPCRPGRRPGLGPVDIGVGPTGTGPAGSSAPSPASGPGRPR